ncbi:MAG TPA: polymer-forming cytoskeletal protein [Candidatus Tumulicola sp.]|nr:polymer-forming cytoskeletal protein [Candidatus Tumulicola sp.]
MWFKSAANNNVGGTSQRRLAPSILSDGFRVEGDVVCSGEVHVDGALSGNLTAAKITIGEGGSVSGTVEAENAVINGSLSGRLVAVDVVLGRSSHVTADIVYCSMRIEPGAVFEGYSRRVERDDVPASDTKQLPASVESLHSAADQVDEIAAHAEVGH